MVKRVILGRSGEERVVDLIKEINERATQGSTRPAGNKWLEDHEDFYWDRNDGTTHSMREVDEGLALAEVRIEDAEQSLADSQVRLDDAEVLVGEVRDDLTRVETEVIPDAVADLEAADQAAAQELATLDGKLVTAQEDLATVEGNVTQLGADLAAEADAREQLAQDTAGTFTELDNRLDTFGDDPALEAMRQALTDAQTVADNAKDAAAAANTAANAASQAALEAAGIAASKGRVIVSETEPTGDDRTPSNIWIKPVPDDPDTEVEEKAVTYVYLEATDEWQPTTSSELAQAAQNALDAREAAQQAQQRAETAISNAATAQSAAEAAETAAQHAQQTADGKNTVTSSTTAPVGSGKTEGDIWFRTNASGAIIGQWTWTGSKWETQEVGSEVIANLDVGKLSAGTTEIRTAVIDQVWANGIAAKSIEANRLVISGANGALVPFPDSYLRGSHPHFSEQPDGSIVYDGVNENAYDNRLLSSSADGQYPEGLYQIEVVAENLGDQDTYATLYHYRYKGTTYSASGYRAGTEYDLPAGEKITHTAVEEIRYDPGETGFAIQSSIASPYMPIKFHSIRVTRVGKVGAVLIENGAVSADQINAESVAGAIGQFVEAEVGNLIAGGATIDDAVINRIWADGISAKAVTASRLTVSSGNAYRDPEISEAAEWGKFPYASWSSAGGYQGGGSILLDRTDGQVYGYDAADNESGEIQRTQVVPGQKYVVSAWVGTAAAYGAGTRRIYVRWHENNAGAERVGLDFYPLPAAIAGEGPQEYSAEFTAPEGARYASIGVWQGEPDMRTRWSNISMRAMTGAVLIEDGAITTPKLTVTEDMSAAIVNAMSVNTKKLVVSEEAILNHATLIGQTVVDDINVQGKLIGTDGVFTGTVDFENVNVTGDLLASKISGEYLYGTLIEAGEFRTSDTLPGQVTLADDAYINSTTGVAHPGIRVEPLDTSDMVRPPGIGPGDLGMYVDGGSDTSGRRSYLRASPDHSLMRSFRENGTTGGAVQTSSTASLMHTDREDGTKGGAIQTAPDQSLMRTYRADGKVGGEIQTAPDASRMRTYSGNSSESGWVRVRPQDAELAYVDPNNTYFSQIKADANEAYLYTRAGGTYRYLTIDANGVWVKERDWEDIDLTAPFRSKWVTLSYPSGFTHPHGAPLAYYRVGKRVYWRGRFAKTDGTPFKAGEWTTILMPSESYKPEYTTALSTPSSGTSLTRIEVSAYSAGITAIPNQDTSWVSIDGLAYDLP